MDNKIYNTIFKVLEENINDVDIVDIKTIMTKLEKLIDNMKDSASYDQGYEAGYDEGYEAGYDEGYEAGYDEGYEAGYEKGKIAQ